MKVMKDYEKDFRVGKNLSGLKRFWDWLWNSESWFSYIVFLVIIFVFIKFIFLPGLGLAFGSKLPLAIVESSSMEHYSLMQCLNADCSLKSGDYEICGARFDKQKKFSLEEYWKTCGGWYEQNSNVNISKEQFSEFSFKNGFRKGDIIIIFGWSKPEIGDVIIFNAGRNHPIIHRMISENPISTKGDHNSGQLSEEKSIDERQIVGVAVAKIPYLGWVKLFFSELLGRVG